MALHSFYTLQLRQYRFFDTTMKKSPKEITPTTDKSNDHFNTFSRFIIDIREINMHIV